MSGFDDLTFLFLLILNSGTVLLKQYIVTEILN